MATCWKQVNGWDHKGQAHHCHAQSSLGHLVHLTWRRWSGSDDAILYIDVSKALKVDFKTLAKHDFLLIFRLKKYIIRILLFSPHTPGVGLLKPGGCVSPLWRLLLQSSSSQTLEYPRISWRLFIYLSQIYWGITYM